MIRLMKRTLTISTMAMALVLAPDVMAQGNSGNAPGKLKKNIGFGNASDGVKAIIHTNRDVFYTGEGDADELEVDVRFPRGGELLSSGEVEAHLMVFSPEDDFDALPLSSEVSTGSRNLFALDSDALRDLPEGSYQLGVVLTTPDGDPLNLDDWYNGLLGLVSVQGLTISSEATDIDEDGDGFVEGDSNGDGMPDEEDDGSTDDGSSDDGSTDDGSTDDGSTDDGSTDDDSTDDGSSDDSSTDDDTTT